MILAGLREEVLKANQDLVHYDLVTLTWGNVSAIDRRQGLVVIKPSGIDYRQMTVQDMVVVDLKGNMVEGKWKPSSDTPTHLELYNAFSSIGGVTHSHSMYATIFCQAGLEIPCYGTTHADHFDGTIPVTRHLTRAEASETYEKHTGTVIIERFTNLDPVAMPAVLVRGHAPFCWGEDAAAAVIMTLILEPVAQMAVGSLLLHPQLEALPDHILEKHYKRKHGPGAYYGQDR